MELWNGQSIITYGNIEKKIVDEIKKAIVLTFEELHFEGGYPQIRISEGKILLSNGDSVPAILEITKKGEKILRLSINAAKSTSAFKSGISENVILALFGAHEAVHFVQIENGVDISEIVANDRETRLTKVSGHSLELEANRIAEIVVKKLYGLEVYLSE